MLSCECRVEICMYDMIAQRRDVVYMDLLQFRFETNVITYHAETWRRNRAFMRFHLYYMK